MDVPALLLEVLKCDECHDYLSYSPVYLKHNGFTLCGRCYVSEEIEPESANRIIQYEAAAKLLKFPCRYQIYGCKETIPFSEDDEEKPHEEGCEFRNYQCPLASEIECYWFGQRKDLVDHFRTCHPTHLANNPCHLMYEIAHFAVKTYIANCFGVIFLIHTKVCIATGKIYHAVQLLDNPEKISQFKYSLDIKREELVISRPGKVMPQNNDALDEKSAIVTNISSMLDFLNGFTGTVFTIKIQKLVINLPKPIQEVEKTSNEPQKSVQEIVKPSTSFTALTLGRLCRNNYRGCTFSDIEVKCEKHEEFFCPFRTWCWLCWAPVNSSAEDAWQVHHTAAHDSFTFQGGENFTITTTGAPGRGILVRTHIGLVHCRYIFQGKTLRLYIWSPSTSKLLKRYRCTLKVTESISSKSEMFVLDKQISEMWDWHIKLEKDNLTVWGSKFNVALQIVKHK